LVKDDIHDGQTCSFSATDRKSNRPWRIHQFCIAKGETRGHVLQDTFPDDEIIRNTKQLKVIRSQISRYWHRNDITSITRINGNQEHGDGSEDRRFPTVCSDNIPHAQKFTDGGKDKFYRILLPLKWLVLETILISNTNLAPSAVVLDKTKSTMLPDTQEIWQSPHLGQYKVDRLAIKRTSS
jgi:hypothetical protein